MHNPCTTRMHGGRRRFVNGATLLTRFAVRAGCALTSGRNGGRNASGMSGCRADDPLDLAVECEAMKADWQRVDGYLAELLVGDDPALEAALAANAAAGLPAIDVSPLQGKLLHLLARMAGARRILEIGTLGGYSTIWLARALPAGRPAGDAGGRAAARRGGAREHRPRRPRRPGRARSPARPSTRCRPSTAPSTSSSSTPTSAATPTISPGRCASPAPARSSSATT